jgi:dihydroflavonol-4-reductase
LHAEVLEKGRGPRRYTCTVHCLNQHDLYSTIARVTGRRIPLVTVPNWVLLGPLKLADAIQRYLPVRSPFNFQSIYIITRMHGWITRMHGWDDSATRREFGIEPRPFDETAKDTIISMVESGRLPPRLAGRLATRQRSPA